MRRSAFAGARDAASSGRGLLRRSAPVVRPVTWRQRPAPVKPPLCWMPVPNEYRPVTPTPSNAPRARATPSIESGLAARALAVFDAYAELDGARREAALAALAASDPDLHGELRHWLDADARSDVLEDAALAVLAARAAPPIEPPADADRIGRRLGAWRIEAILGRGGMGTVYRARRDDGAYRQVVAIKCVSGAGGSTLRKALGNERQALATLRHPAIAAVFDGGLDETGDPWFAMPLVDGPPIDVWCARHGLDLRARVALFVKACQGVAHAHGCGRLHGDIKPSNLLVEAGRPLLLDFGLSVALAEGAERLCTAVTPGYAAPEVMAGGALSVAADIHALGVVLYRLLCACWPAGVEPSAFQALAGWPPPQSPSRLADRRGLAPGLPRAAQLRGDLDAIALRCVAVDPARRYGSVAALLDDLNRWSSLRPLHGRSCSIGYRAGLLLRRHPAAAIAGTLAFALAAATIAHRSQSAQATRALQDLSGLYQVSLAAWTDDGASLDEAERQVLRRDVDAAAQAAGLPVLARRRMEIGDHDRAAALLTQAPAPRLLDARQRAGLDAVRAHLLNDRSDALGAARVAEAALARLGTTPADAPARIALQAELTRAWWGRGEPQQAALVLREAFTAAGELAVRDPAPLTELLLLRGQRRLQTWQYAAAERDLRAALDGAGGRRVADAVQADLVRAALGREAPAEAERQARALLDARRSGLGETHLRTGWAWIALAQVQYAQARLDQAQQSVRRGEAIVRAAQPGDTPALAQALGTAALIEALDGDLALAVDQARQSLAIAQAVHGSAHERTLEAMLALGSLLAWQASLADTDLAALASAVDLHRLGLHESLRQGLPTALHRLFLIRAQAVRRDPADSEAELRPLIAELTRLRGPASDRALQARYALADVVMRQRREAEAAVLLRALADDAQTRLPSLVAGVSLASALEALGDLDRAAGRTQRAAEHWRQAREVATGLIGRHNPVVQRLAAKLGRLQTGAAAAAPGQA